MSRKSVRLRHGGNRSIYTHTEQHDKNTREQREAAHNGPGLLVNNKYILDTHHFTTYYTTIPDPMHIRIYMGPCQ